MIIVVFFVVIFQMWKVKKAFKIALSWRGFIPSLSVSYMT